MTHPSPEVRRTPDGAIDYDYYRARIAAERSQRFSVGRPSLGYLVPALLALAACTVPLWAPAVAQLAAAASLVPAALAN
jgi:hypothetical protein